MTREDVYKEVEKMLGFVPGFLKRLPEDTLASEWQLFRRLRFEEGRIPPKYRALIGLALASVEKSRYHVYATSRFARRLGATDEEIEEAIHYAKHMSGWATYIEGLQPDFEEYKSEVDRAIENVARRIERKRAA